MLDDFAAGLTDFGLLHFQPQVGPFAGSLADAGKHRVTAVGTGDAGDQLGQNHGLAQAGPAEQAGLAAADERREQVDDFDARFKKLGLGRQIGDRRSVAVDRPALFGIHRAAAVDRIAHEIEHPAERGRSDRHLHGGAGVDAIHAADHAVGAAQGHATDAAAAQLLLDFAVQVQLHPLVFGGDQHGIIDCRQMPFGKFDVEGRADDLGDVADFGRFGKPSTWRLRRKVC